MMKKNVHVIVAGPEISENKIKFRRRRLAEYLAQKKETEFVFWIFFTQSQFKDAGKIHFINSTERLKIYQIEIFDYKFLITYSSFLQKLFLRKIFKLIKGFENNPKYLWYTVPRFSALSNISFTKIIYDCSDYWRGQYSSSILSVLKKKILIHTEKRIISTSHLCFASSEFLFNYLSEKTKRAVLIENGVDFLHFRNNNKISEELLHITGPKFGFIGDMLPLKIDFDLLMNMAIQFPDWNIVLVGPSEYPNLANTSFYQLINLKNVFYKDFIEFENIPQYFNGLDVALLPYKDEEFNEGVFPIKFFEYLAAGKPVVGIGLPATKKYCQENVYYYSLNRNEFIENCKLALKTMDKKNYRRLIAEKADWSKKFSAMYKKVLNMSN